MSNISLKIYCYRNINEKILNTNRGLKTQEKMCVCCVYCVRISRYISADKTSIVRLNAV
jgi:hypothetical protein